MKELLLILFMFGTILNSYCQNILITQLSATSVTGGVNVNVKTISGTGSGYLSNTYTVTGNIIDLSVCYWFDNTLPVLQFDNDFLIPLTTTGNYTVNVHIKLSTSQVTCDNFATTDNGTTNVSFLSTNNFEQIKDDYTFFPNPTNGKVEYKGNELTINKIDIFDNVGRLVKQVKTISTNSLDLNELNDGVYLVKIQTENGNLNQKIIIKK
jgi:hypothetical protein